LRKQNLILVLEPFRWTKLTATRKDMVLVRSGMVDLVVVVVDGAHMAAEVEDLAAEVEVVHAVLALYLTSDPMTTVCAYFWTTLSQFTIVNFSFLNISSDFRFSPCLRILLRLISAQSFCLMTAYNR